MTLQQLHQDQPRVALSRPQTPEGTGAHCALRPSHSEAVPYLCWTLEQNKGEENKEPAQLTPQCWAMFTGNHCKAVWGVSQRRNQHSWGL